MASSGKLAAFSTGFLLGGLLVAAVGLMLAPRYALVDARAEFSLDLNGNKRMKGDNDNGK